MYTDEQYKQYSKQYAVRFAYRSAKDYANPLARIGASLIQSSMLVATLLTFFSLSGFLSLPLIVLYTSIYKGSTAQLKLLDMKHFLSKQDKRALLANVKEGEELRKEIKKYETFAEMPKQTQRKIERYFKRQYQDANRMKEAIANAKEAMAKSLIGY